MKKIGNCIPNNKEIIMSLLRKTKKAYYKYFDERKVSDNRLLWKTVKPLLSKKIPCQRKYKLQ